MNMLEQHIVEVHGITNVTDTINKDMLTNIFACVSTSITNHDIGKDK